MRIMNQDRNSFYDMDSGWEFGVYRGSNLPETDVRWEIRMGRINDKPSSEKPGIVLGEYDTEGEAKAQLRHLCSFACSWYMP